jgi:hypothetical protein
VSVVGELPDDTYSRVSNLNEKTRQRAAGHTGADSRRRGVKRI